MKLLPGERAKVVSLRLYIWSAPILGTLQRVDDEDDAFVFTGLDPGFVTSFNTAQVETVYHETGVPGAV